MTNNERIEFKFSRKEFYEKLWSMPTTKLAAELGCSDVLIGKICKAYKIPKPYLGYWAMLAHGKKPKRTRLPKNDDPQIQSLTFFKCAQQEPTVNEPPRESLYDPDIQELLAKTEKLGPIKVADSLRNPHPLIQSWKSEWARRDANDKLPWLDRPEFKYQSILDIFVTDKESHRALRIMDALIKRIESLGGKVEVRAGSDYRRMSTTMIVIAGANVTSIRLRERTNMVRVKGSKSDSLWDRNKTENIPNGLLLFDDGPCDYYNWMPKDTKKKRLEDLLTGFVIQCIKRVGESRITQREEERARLELEEKARIEREAAADFKRRRDELKRLQAMEQLKVDKLLARAKAWRKSQIIVEYLDFFCQMHVEDDGTMNIHGEAADYLRWAHAQADRLNPFRPSPPSILDQTIES